MKQKILIIILLFGIFTGFLFPSEDEENTKEWENYLPVIRLTPDIIQLLENQQWRQAIKILEKNYKLINGEPKLRFYIVYCYEHLGVNAFNEKRYQDAIEHLNKAIQFVDDLAHIHAVLGVCYFSLSDYEKAEETFLRAIEIDPNHFRSLRMLGEICYLTNRMKEARSYFEKALEIKSDDKLSKKRLDGLKKYGEISDKMETEADNLFMVSFDGKKNPRLREMVVNMLGEISSRIDQQLGLYPKRQISVSLLTNVEFFDITGSPQWSGGVYEGHIKIPVDKYKKDLLKVVLTHEYIHAVIYDCLSYRCPWWLNEGLAQYFSGDTERNPKKLALVKKQLKEGFRVPLLETLPGEDKNPDSNTIDMMYALSFSAINYFMDNYGVNDMQYILTQMAEGREFGSMVTEITGYSFDEFQKIWIESMAQ